eukprot:354337-Chlamydomonas_euryale.AAC.3
MARLARGDVGTGTGAHELGTFRGSEYSPPPGRKRVKRQRVNGGWHSRGGKAVGTAYGERRLAWQSVNGGWHGGV